LRINLHYTSIFRINDLTTKWDVLFKIQKSDWKKENISLKKLLIFILLRSFDINNPILKKCQNVTFLETVFFLRKYRKLKNQNYYD
jgi:hypothetical protein